MKLGVTKLSSSVRLALSLGAVIAAGASGSAFAQTTTSGQGTDAQPNATEQKAANLQTVVVTGSHIRRVDLETASPVVTIDSAAIKASGKVTLGDLVQQLPAMTGGMTNPQINNAGGAGSSTVALRGLGPNRSLILVDGHRVVSSDVNSIPADMIERIDVLTTGASSVYGSDAVGGVVNFILKKNYQGAQFTTNVGESDQNDGDQSGYSFTFGQTSDKASIAGGVSYNKMDGISASRRPFSSQVTSYKTLNSSGIYQGVIGGSVVSPSGYVQIPPNSAGAYPGCDAGAVTRNSGASGQSLGDYHCFGQSDRYNYAAQNLIETPQERTNVFVMGSYNLTDHITAYMNAYYNKTTSNSELAPANLTSQQGLTLSGDSAFNPFGTKDVDPANGLLFGPSDYLLYTRLNNNRIFSNATTTGQISTGFKGDFPVGSRNWTYEVGLDYGHESTTSILRGLPNVNTLNEGTGASFVNPATGLVTCGTAAAPISGCFPFNPLNLQSAQSLAALANASTPTNSLAYSIEKVWHAEVSGGLFDLPAGTVQLAAGLSYRTEYLNDKVDAQLQTNPATGLCILGSSCSASEQGSYNVKEGYAELFVPILQDLPGIQSLNVTLGDRYSKFSDFGSTNNAKVSLEWKPINDLLLRGTVAEVFRAPNIAEVYGPPAIDYENISADPCDGYTGAPANPACRNVPTNGTYKSIYDGGNQQVGILSSGSAYAGYPLKPEQGKTFDLGAVYSPSWAPGLSTSVDVWHLYLNNTITSVGVQSLLDLCSGGATAFCPYINRIASGPNQGQLAPTTVAPTVNLGSTSTGGIDFSANYKLPQFDQFGQFSLGLNATYLKYYDVNTAPGTDQNTVYHNAGHFQAYQSAAAADCPGAVGNCLFPRWRGQGYVNWQLGGWDASWRLRYIGRFQNGYNDINESPFVLKYGATTYNDVSMGYNIEPLNTKIAFGVNNLFDKQPPNLYGNQTLNANTDPSDFDTIGRYFWGRVTVSF